MARFRNTVIGTLVQDLSAGVDLEVAVKSYETKVAPQNYKRPTALITKAMVESAKGSRCALAVCFHFRCIKMGAKEARLLPGDWICPFCKAAALLV